MERLPSTVYKYFNWSDTESKKILTEKQIYFCNAKRWQNYGEYNFNFKTIDRQQAFEIIEVAVYNMRNREFHLFEKWFHIHAYKYKIDLSSYDRLSEIERDHWEVRIIDEIIWHRVADIVNNRQKYETSIKNYYFNRTGIFSTSLVKDSEQLWAWKNNYKQEINGNAVCIGLNLPSIKQRLDEIGNYSLGVIKYEENTNEVEFIGTGNDFLVNQLNSITFTLQKDAALNITEQQEVRIMKFLTRDMSKRSPERFMAIDDDFIMEIIVSSSASDVTKKEIEEIAKNIGCTNLTCV